MLQLQHSSSAEYTLQHLSAVVNPALLITFFSYGQSTFLQCYSVALYNIYSVVLCIYHIFDLSATVEEMSATVEEMSGTVEEMSATGEKLHMF